MAAGRFRSPKHPKQSKVARGGMTDDKTRRWLTYREVLDGTEPSLYTPPARRCLYGLRNLLRRKREAIRRDLRKKAAQQSGG